MNFWCIQMLFIWSDIPVLFIYTNTKTFTIWLGFRLVYYVINTMLVKYVVLIVSILNYGQVYNEEWNEIHKVRSQRFYFLHQRQ